MLPCFYSECQDKREMLYLVFHNLMPYIKFLSSLTAAQKQVNRVPWASAYFCSSVKGLETKKN